MEISGKVVAILALQEGVSRAGNEWKKQEYIIETEEQFPKKVCFQIFGADKISQSNIQQGERITVSFDIESREFNGKWYTNINAWKVSRSEGRKDNAPEPIQPSGVVYQSSSEAPEFPPPEPSEDLPF
ncbi:MAG: DUF3127 domain-containing protein [Tannerellaceae bacterium]|jgi:uncharacterized protein YegL|nr:DUF3127 domain-containing protein [Tannerellaceae bacterium]